MPLLHTLHHLTAFRSPFLRTLLPSIGLAFALQSAVAVPSIVAQSERFYDLSGSLTYLSVVGLSLYLPTLRARIAAETAVGGGGAAAASVKWPGVVDALAGRPGAVWNWRQVVLSAAVGVWAIRLGSYLFQRVLGDGHDSRFDTIKKSPPSFFGAFMAQATWVSLCSLPILALNSLPAATFAALPRGVLITDVLGLALFAGGLAFEITADRQKAAWSAARKRKEHDEQFLTHGLWSRSRHPNYFGESTLWCGLATMAGGVLASRVGVQGMGLGGLAPVMARAVALSLAAASPAFVTFLLLKVSGVPLSEKKYDERYGDRKDYQEWKKNTPKFIPKF